MENVVNGSRRSDEPEHEDWVMVERFESENAAVNSVIRATPDDSAGTGQECPITLTISTSSGAKRTKDGL